MITDNNFPCWYPKSLIKKYEDNTDVRKCDGYSNYEYKGIMDTAVPLQRDLQVHQLRINGHMGGAPGLG